MLRWLCRRSARSTDATLLALVEAEFRPARLRRSDILVGWPDLGRKTRAAQVRVGVVVEVHGGVDQHAVPFAGTEQGRVAVALAGRGIEPGAERRWHDDDVVFASIYAIGDGPIHRRVI